MRNGQREVSRAFGSSADPLKKKPLEKWLLIYTALVFHGPVCNVISWALQGMWQLSLRHSDDGRPGPVVRKGIWGLFPLENQNNSTDLPCARMCLLAQPSPLLLLIDRVWALFRSLSIALQRVTRSASYKQTALATNLATHKNTLATT